MAKSVLAHSIPKRHVRICFQEQSSCLILGVGLVKDRICLMKHYCCNCVDKAVEDGQYVCVATES